MAFDFSKFEPPVSPLLRPVEAPKPPEPQKQLALPPIDANEPILVDCDVVLPPAESVSDVPKDIPFEPKLSGFPPQAYSTDPNDNFPFEPAFPEIDNLADVHYILYPEIKLYPWQLQELLRLSGYVDGTLSGPRVHYNPHQAFRATYVTVNGSGKDMVLIATLALGAPLLYQHVVIVITSASYEQLKHQTEVHIRNGAEALKRKFGFDVYDCVEFHYRCKARFSEIKLYVTDEERRVEGWHPRHPKGRLILIVNEAKSIPPPVFTAFDRCSGYSHWIEISSPGSKRGLFYNNFLSAVHYPDKPQRGKYFARRVFQKECPHKSEEDRKEMLRKHGEFSYVYQTSVECNFWEEETSVAIPLVEVLSCSNVEVNAEDEIGLGLDYAGGGDETVLYVRYGPKQVLFKAYVDPRILDVADRIHEELRIIGIRPAQTNYTFNYDNGGLGMGPGDYLVRKGWTLLRRNNQSPAFDKTLYVNLGAEMYGHLRRLYQNLLVPVPADQKTLEQLTSRRVSVTESIGKRALESKKAAKSRGASSPDRADAWVLCYFSYRPAITEVMKPEVAPKRLMSPAELIARCDSDFHFLENLMKPKQIKRPGRTFSYQDSSYE